MVALTRKGLFLTVAILAFGVWMLAACSSGGGDAVDGDLDGEGELSGDEDRDAETAEEEVTEVEAPEVERIPWEDDTLDRWQDPAFCAGGALLFLESFEDGETTTNPVWQKDHRVLNVPDDQPESAVRPVVIEDAEVGGRVLSGCSDDTGSQLPTARLYTPLPAQANAFHFRTKLGAEGTENLFWFERRRQSHRKLGAGNPPVPPSRRRCPRCVDRWRSRRGGRRPTDADRSAYRRAGAGRNGPLQHRRPRRGLAPGDPIPSDQCPMARGCGQRHPLFLHRHHRQRAPAGLCLYRARRLSRRRPDGHLSPSRTSRWPARPPPLATPIRFAGATVPVTRRVR